VRKVLEEAPTQPEKVIEKVIEGTVQKRKQPLGKRVRAAFLDGSTESVKDYIILDLVIPNIKDLIADVVSGGIERMIFGEGAASRGRRSSGRHHGGGGGSRYDYAGVSRGPIQQYRGREEPRQQLSRRARMSHTFDEIEFTNRVDAETVLTQMFDLLDRFEVVTVADFYGLTGNTPDFTDHNWGWTDIRGTLPRRIRGGGFILDLPPTEPID
jgi:hypothetical protein